MPLTEQQNKAVGYIVDDRKSNEAIAAIVGVTARTITNWKHDPEFKDAVDVLRAELFEQARQEFLTNRAGRLSHKMARHRRLSQLIVEPDVTLGGMEILPGCPTPPMSTTDKVNFLVECKAISAISRELSRLESEIAAEHSQIALLDNYTNHGARWPGEKESRLTLEEYLDANQKIRQKTEQNKEIPGNPELNLHNA